MLTRSILMLFAVMIFATTSFGLDMNEGDWKVSMTTTMQGLPFQMPAQTYTMTQCLTKDDLAPASNSKKNCVYKDKRYSGNTFHWKAVCEDESGRTEGDGTITFSGSSYQGTINTTITDRKSSQTMTARTKMTGSYLGPCSAATKAEAEKRKEQYRK